jgi:hypothetical protein
MTPAEMREVLLDEARWWANQPAHAGSAHPWVTFFEQLPEDDQMLVMLSGMYQGANVLRWLTCGASCARGAPGKNPVVAAGEILGK